MWQGQVQGKLGSLGIKIFKRKVRNRAEWREIESKMKKVHKPTQNVDKEFTKWQNNEYISTK